MTKTTYNTTGIALWAGLAGGGLYLIKGNFKWAIIGAVIGGTAYIIHANSLLNEG